MVHPGGANNFSLIRLTCANESIVLFYPNSYPIVPLFYFKYHTTFLMNKYYSILNYGIHFVMIFNFHYSNSIF